MMMRRPLTAALLLAFYVLLHAGEAAAQRAKLAPEERAVADELRKLDVDTYRRPEGGWNVSFSQCYRPQLALDVLRQLPAEQIERMTFVETSVTDEMLQELTRYTALEEVTLYDTFATSKVLPTLAALPKLKTLNLRGDFTDAGMQHLKELKQLENLELGPSDITDETLKFVAECQNLQVLAIRGVSVTDAGLAHLEKLHNLTVLTLALLPCTDEALAMLRSMPKLEVLMLYGHNFSEAVFPHLVHCKNLKILNLSRTAIRADVMDAWKQKHPEVRVGGQPPLKKPEPLGARPKAERRKPKTGPPAPPPLAVALPENYYALPTQQDTLWTAQQMVFSGATSFLPRDNAGPILRFKVDQPGVLVLAACWDDEGPLTPEQRKVRRSLGQLLAEGWQLHNLQRRYRIGSEATDRYYLLVKHCRAGEKFELLTRHKSPPLLILPSQVFKHRLPPQMQPAMQALAPEKLLPRDPLAGRAQHDTVLMAACAPQMNNGVLDGSLLIGEVARQAILLAAEHELGLPAADLSSGVALPRDPQPANRPLEVAMTILLDSIDIAVLRGDGKQLQLQWHQQVPVGEQQRATQYEQCVAQFERDARTIHGEELRTLGFSGKPLLRHESAEVDPRAAALLPEINGVAQFAAIQRIHQQLAAEGESPERLSALARAYANLSVLTEFHFRALKTVCRARAVLYAERLGALWPESPLVLPTRAYAWAMVGRQQTALAALAEHASRQPAASPAWLAPIAAFCDFDRAALTKLTDDPQQGGWSRVLLLLGSLGYRDLSYVLSSAAKVLEHTPDCYLAIEQIHQYPALGTEREAIGRAMQCYRDHFAARLKQLPHLSDAMRKHVEQAEARLADPDRAAASVAAQLDQVRRLVQALRGKDAAAEGVLAGPANDVLAAMLDDLLFTHAWNYLTTQKDSFGLPIEDERKALCAALADYPLVLVLTALADDERIASEARQQLLQSLHMADANPTWFEFTNVLPFYTEAAFKPLREATRWHLDAIYADVRTSGRSEALPVLEKPYRWILYLQQVAPRMPATRAISIEVDAKWTVELGKQQARQHKDEVGILVALADRFRGANELKLAEQCWRRHYELAPSIHGLKQLAELLREQKRMDEWLETLERALDLPARGLEHASIHHQIARHFLHQREFRRALPYAREAAESYSSFGLLIAAQCYEALQDWDEAEAYYRAESERYSNSAAGWYLFCRRTGQGRRSEALALASDLILRLEQGKDDGMPFTQAAFYLLQKQPEKALTVYRDLAEEQPSPFYWLLTAHAADIGGDEEARHAALVQAVTCAEDYAKKFPEFPSPEFPALARLLLAARQRPHTAERPAGLDRKEVERLLTDHAKGAQLELHYFLGSYYAQRDQEELAVEHWMKCMASPWINYHLRTLAGAELLERAITPDDYRAALHEGPKEAANEQREEEAPPKDDKGEADNGDAERRNTERSKVERGGDAESGDKSERGKAEQ